MRLTPYGTKQIGIGAVIFVALAVALLLAYRHWHSPWFLAALIPLIALFGWMLWFFRDPDRSVPAAPGLIVSPADGVITHVDTGEELDFIGGPAERCSIFLSIFNVHLNRAPVAGQVVFKRFRPGAFYDARREDSLAKNQNQDIGLLTNEPGMPSKVVVRQSTGAIARTIVCPVEEGTMLHRGERYGMIKFGSRTTLFLSRDADIVWQVKEGDTVKAGETILAVIRPAPEKNNQPKEPGL